ncbi:MAG: heme exporter protein CcmB [Cellvibrionales bacterium]|jgi:heme exporter protein B
MHPEPAQYFVQQFARQFRSSLRRPGDIANPLLFFLMVTALFPLGLGPDPRVLATLAPGILWVVALLSSQTVSGRLFTSDFEDGSLEQMALAPQPLALAAMAEVLAHWLLSGVTLALVSPVFAAMLNLPYSAIPTTMFSLLLGTLCLSLTGAIGAALTVGLRRAGVLLSLLTIPLTVPTLIFGSAAVREAALGYDPSSWLALLGALAAVGLVLAPFAVAAGLRISLEA